MCLLLVSPEAPWGQRTHSSCSLLWQNLVRCSASMHASEWCSWSSSAPHPNVTPPPSRHRIPSPSCQPPRQAAIQMLGLNKGKARCPVSYVKQQSRSLKAVGTSSQASVVICLHCEAGDVNPSIYFWMRVLCLIYSDSFLDWNIIFYEQ